MASIQLQQTDRLLEGSFPRSILRQSDNQAIHNVATLSAASNGQLYSEWEDLPSAVGHGAVSAQGILRDPRHINMAYDCLEDYPPLPDNPAVPYTYPKIGLDQHALEHDRVVYPQDKQGNDPFVVAPQGVVQDPTQAAFPGPLAHQNSGLCQPAAENLRQFASRYVLHPDSQIDMVRVEPGSAGRYKVVIVVEMEKLF